MVGRGRRGWGLPIRHVGRYIDLKSKGTLDLATKITNLVTIFAFAGEFSLDAEHVSSMAALSSEHVSSVTAAFAEHVSSMAAASK